jgi:hypothetical protein
MLSPDSGARRAGAIIRRERFTVSDRGEPVIQVATMNTLIY